MRHQTSFLIDCWTKIKIKNTWLKITTRKERSETKTGESNLISHVANLQSENNIAGVYTSKKQN